MADNTYIGVDFGGTRVVSARVTAGHIENVCDLLGEIETKSYAFCIDVFRRLKESEQLEEFHLVLLFDSDACVLYLHFKMWTVRVVEKLNKFWV